MPRRRYNRQKKPRYQPRRRRYVHRPLRNKVPHGASPVARKHVVRMKYVDVIDWNPSTLATQTQVFNMNGIFDPDQTGTGHQPYGYDQLAALFAHYRVFKFSWHIEFAPSNDRLHVCVIPINGQTAPTDVTVAGEQPYGVTKAMSFDGGPPAVFKGHQYLSRFTGATSVQYKTDDRYSAVAGNNPTEIMRLHLLVYNPSSQTVNTSCNVTLMYYTEWYDPLTVGQS